jgi:hypothetical protein
MMEEDRKLRGREGERERGREGERERGREGEWVLYDRNGKGVSCE